MALDIRIRFGRAIRRVREEQKINQEEAAERCGLHRTYYSGVERGSGTCPWGISRRLLKV
jgi:transcriptional regulator with XRE-family HTH domain